MSFAVVLGFAALACRGEPNPKLDDYGELPAFRLVDQLGRPLARRDLDGQTTIVNFIFTRCPTVCPTVSMKLSRVQDALREKNANVQILSISVDPEHDTPEVLAEFASKFGADPKRWKFLTGSRDVIENELLAAAKLALERRGDFENGAPNIIHGTHFLLVDGTHRIRGYYNSDQKARIDQLIKDAVYLDNK